ncbi:acetamidase/formamidase family protein [Effusibacillus lacus]|uniref:Acetamidase n=1 Tax=Effusibacillus lacus TaxID=1348429 RepID=A0A292YNW5_9BACL|nr:acetamidase/formamidase family protein [Effusibacillus lacus]TCS69525.1 amidase [Effusibacillus lacus]GAX90064.1 acetamidase [Effusibacillus lacus]
MYRIPKEHLIYAMAPTNEPVLFVKPGASVAFETCDCFEDQIQSADAQFSELDWNRINPATGPVYVEGAEPGDILVVRIQKIELADHGVMVAGPKLGVIGDRLDSNVIKMVPIRNGKAIFNDKLEIPLNPMIGVIGTAPANEAISNGTPGDHGGNMDCKQIREGTTLLLPVNVPGALFALGDLHAAMGDGEIVVCGVEIAGEVTVELDLIKGKDWQLPMAVTTDHVITIASAKLLDEAADRAVKNMIHWLEKEVGLDTSEAGMLLSIASDLRVCQVVDPLKTARVELPRWIVEKYGVKVPE